MDEPRRALERWQAGQGELAPITKLLGIQLTQLSIGAATVSMKVQPDHLNHVGEFHGGLLPAIMDVAFGVALFSVLDPGQGLSTVDMNVSFFKRVRSGRIRATAQVVRRGRQMAYLECVATNSADELICKGTSTWIITQPL